MKLIILSFLLSIFCSLLKAQSKNDLTGEFYGSENFLNHKFHFLGNGKVIINDEILGEFFYENDSLFVLRNLEFSVYKIDQNKLIGLSNLEKNNNFKLKKNTANTINLIEIENPRANWLKKFYKINSNVNIDSSSNLNELVIVYTEVNKLNQDLCLEGFDLACIQNFAFTTHLLMNENQKDTVDLNLLKSIAEQVIALGNSDGYGLMYSYFVMSDQENLGEKFLEKGLELGSELCLKLSLDKMNIEKN